MLALKDEGSQNESLTLVVQVKGMPVEGPRSTGGGVRQTVPFPLQKHRACANECCFGPLGKCPAPFPYPLFRMNYEECYLLGSS